MNKSDLIAAVAANAELNKRKARKAVDCLLDRIIQGMKQQERITITGFGSFNVVPRAKKVTRNLRTGERMITPARNAVVFKAGKELNGYVNNKNETNHF